MKQEIVMALQHRSVKMPSLTLNKNADVAQSYAVIPL